MLSMEVEMAKSAVGKAKFRVENVKFHANYALGALRELATEDEADESAKLAEYIKLFTSLQHHCDALLDLIDPQN